MGRGFDAFAPPGWTYALPDGTFGNRFDDPSAERDVPEEERYRVVYCATGRAGAFGETVARFRPSLELLAGLKQVEDEEPLDPELEGGIIPEEWRLSPRLGSTRLAPGLPFADLAAPETMRVLREELADKGFTGVEWERLLMERYGALVAATPKNNSRRAWAKADRRWASGKRQIIEGVIGQLKDFFGLERHRAKTLGGLLVCLAAKVAAYTCGQRINDTLGRPLRHLADLLI